MQERTREPLNWLGVFFAVVATLFVVTLVSYVAQALLAGSRWGLPLTLISALLSGIGTAFYVKARGGMHAFLGGLISMPFLAIFTFGGQWQPAVIAGALCGMGGTVGDLIRRRDKATMRES